MGIRLFFPCAPSICRTLTRSPRRSGQHLDTARTLDDLARAAINNRSLQDRTEQGIQQRPDSPQPRQQHKHLRQQPDLPTLRSSTDIQQQTAIHRNGRRTRDARKQPRARHPTIRARRDGLQGRDQDGPPLGENPQLARQRIGRDSRVVGHDAHQQQVGMSGALGPSETERLLRRGQPIHPQMPQHEQTRREAVGEDLHTGAWSLAAGAAAARQRQRGFHVVLHFRGARAQQEERHQHRERQRRRVQCVDRRRRRRRNDPQRRQRFPPVCPDDQEDGRRTRYYGSHFWDL